MKDKNLLLALALAKQGGGGGTGVVKKTIEGTIANPFSVEEANEIWEAIHSGTGDAFMSFTTTMGSATVNFNAETYDDAKLLLASLTAPAGQQVAALCLMYFISEDSIFLGQKLVYAITPSGPSVMDASILVANNLVTETSITEYEQSTRAKTLTVTENGTYSEHLYNPVVVSVPITEVEPLNVTANGTYTAQGGKAYSPVTVNVPPTDVFSFFVNGSGSFKVRGTGIVDFGTSSVDLIGRATLQTIEFSFDSLHRIEVKGSIGYINFTDCAALVSVVSPLPRIYDLVNLFRNCTNLRTVPNDLFYKCTTVKDFSMCFFGCTSLTEIPSGLFDNCTAVTNFDQCFRECNSLTEIPSGLFDNCTAVTDFAWCFANCTSLTGFAPELWNTTIWPSVTEHTYCFYECTGLTNYADIPADWKQGVS